jgi:uncharacterized membrane protein required for colicin V production
VVHFELVWFVIVLLFGLIGIVRGFLRELGVTTVMLVMIFGVTTFDKKINPLLHTMAVKAAASEAASVEAIVWLLLVVGTAFVSYQGQTLAFEGNPPKPPVGTLLAFGTGLVNGYLIAGSMWYYLDRLNYPLLHVSRAAFSPTAQALLTILPPKLLGPYLVFLVVFLILMRVIR